MHVDSRRWIAGPVVKRVTCQRSVDHKGNQIPALVDHRTNPSLFSGRLHRRSGGWRRPQHSHVYTLSHKTKSWRTHIQINGKEILMEVDTGATLSLISEETYRDNFSSCFLQSTEVRLKTYSAQVTLDLGHAYFGLFSRWTLQGQNFTSESHRNLNYIAI